MDISYDSLETHQQAPCPRSKGNQGQPQRNLHLFISLTDEHLYFLWPCFCLRHLVKPAVYLLCDLRWVTWHLGASVYASGKRQLDKMGYIFQNQEERGSMIPSLTCKILLNSVSEYDTLNLSLPTVQERSIREETLIKVRNIFLAPWGLLICY